MSSSFSYLRTSYDELPYPSLPYAYSHPDHLAAVATLLGLTPAPADRCRVLELGCASGGNLIPLASVYPDSTFLGIDLSGEQVGQGKRVIEALGLENVEIRQMSILGVDDQFGTFDFIICHGVYSWVAEPVQDKILEICARQLSPRGIGFISYNTYPGWHMRGMIRAMMGLHDQRFHKEPPLARVAQARSLLAFLAEAVPQENTPYSLLLREHLQLLDHCSDSYLFHEHLEECNQPIYFMDFCERLAAKGLRYLGESEFRTMVPATSFPPEVQQRLRVVAPSFLEMEQYMDLLRNRMFRQTLICHENLRPCYDVKAERLTVFHVSSPLRPVSHESDSMSEASEDFETLSGMSLNTSSPIVKAALMYLGQIWPRPVAFNSLLEQARSRLGHVTPEDHSSDAQALGKALLTAYASGGRGLVEFSLNPPRFTTEVTEKPVASPFARLEAGSGHQVTNLRHELIELTPFDAHLLPLLDGGRERLALIEGLLNRLEKGAMRITEDDQPVTDRSRAREILGQILDQQLPKLAKAALLLA